MSHRPNGERTCTCPICGQGYRRTNWMIRRRGPVVEWRGERIKLRDTHMIACHKRKGKP